MWSSAFESKPVHNRYSWLSQAGRTAEPIRINSAVLNWFRRRTSHELNSSNSIRLMWSTASELGLSLPPLCVIQKKEHKHGLTTKLIWVNTHSILEGKLRKCKVKLAYVNATFTKPLHCPDDISPHHHIFPLFATCLHIAISDGCRVHVGIITRAKHSLFYYHLIWQASSN